MTTCSATISIPIRKFVNAEQWEAEDLAGRLGTVAHAAFLRAGFLPHGAEPRSGHLLSQVDEIGPSAPSLSRRYTLPQLAARRDGSATETAVLELRAAGAHGRDFAFQAYLLAGDGDRRRLCQALLDEADLAPILSGGVDDAARALGTDAGAWLWRSLVDWVCRVLQLELCRRNGLPVTSFASLPDDVRAEILKRLTDGVDLARVECVDRQLRRLVAERDGELWQPLHDDLPYRWLRRFMGDDDDGDEASGSDELLRWKERYVKARKYIGVEKPRPRRRMASPLSTLFSTLDDPWPWRLHAPVACVYRPINILPLRSPPPLVLPHVEYINEPESPPPARSRRRPEPEMVARGRSAGGRRGDVATKGDKRRRQGAGGAIHSPSSRYRWKHR
ncbi:hypothetical protein ACP4OV_010983 [Aristida adscensionis]